MSYDNIIPTNGSSQLVQTDASGALPALSAANLTNLPGANLVPGSVANAALAAMAAGTIKGNLSGSPATPADNALIDTRNALDLPRVDVASAATTAIGAASSAYVRITGTTTITAFDNVAAGLRRLVLFQNALTLTYNATSLILPGAANLVTQPGDVAEFVSEGSGNWRCVTYLAATGQVGATGGVQVFTASGTFTVPPGVYAVNAEVVGGGGGSPNASVNQVTGGGGGGGYACKLVTELTPGGTVAVTVGAGGAVGGTGGTSSFGSFCSAFGGPGGSSTGGATGGGSGSGGDVNGFGGWGGSSFFLSASGAVLALVGAGGGTQYSQGLPSEFFGNVAVPANGGMLYGGGAGGAVGNGSSGANGAVGADGIVIVRW